MKMDNACQIPVYSNCAIKSLEYQHKSRIKLKDIRLHLCLDSLDFLPQHFSEIGQSDSLFIEILIEPLLKIIYIPFQVQQPVFQINRCMDGLATLRIYLEMRKKK